MEWIGRVQRQRLRAHVIDVLVDGDADLAEDHVLPVHDDTVDTIGKERDLPITVLAAARRATGHLEVTAAGVSSRNRVGGGGRERVQGDAHVPYGLGEIETERLLAEELDRARTAPFD